MQSSSTAFLCSSLNTSFIETDINNSSNLYEYFDTVTKSNDNNFECKKEDINYCTVEAMDEDINKVVIAARSELNKLNIMPENSYEINVSAITREYINVYTNEINNKEIISYDILIYPTYNNIPVLSKDNGIYLMMTNGGISYMEYKWNDVVINDTLDTSSLYSPDIIKQKNNTENLKYRQVYIPDSDDYILAYQFGEGEGFNNSSFYNAKTGCLINDGGSND